MMSQVKWMVLPFYFSLGVMAVVIQLGNYVHDHHAKYFSWVLNRMVTYYNGFDPISQGGWWQSWLS